MAIYEPWHASKKQKLVARGIGLGETKRGREFWLQMYRLHRPGGDAI